ncbi:ras GTPase-activating protein-binding protein 1 [Eutrema salsugineum]|uniref:ras GTPase-activating protein-binding protein 1 n=1 Tax=Eutrema salsugineum TaxID=72664 RepID=UPI000CED69F1|nr:ras GTPase-activating protein-binding protein 1 [Eutrema salsugineum]
MAPKSNAPSMDPQIVGNAFVHKYYNHLYRSPEEVHRFYLEESMLGRPGLDGSMVSVKSLKCINDQIMSFDYQNSKIQILSADSQASLKNGVVTLVAGLVTEKDGGRKKFTQSFFLVPQKGSYFVLNDVFRYVSDEIVEPKSTKEVKESPQVIKSSKDIIPAESADATANTIKNVHKEKAANGNSNLPKAAAEAKPQEDAPKRSFSAISPAQNGTPVNVKAWPAKPKPVAKPGVVVPEQKAPAPIPERSSAENIEEAGHSGSIFVANLPMDTTWEQLYETFKGFGTIRKRGIQVRCYKETRNCFGFVAFETVEAMKNVLQAHKESPIRIGNRRTSIEEKRSKNNENGGRDSAQNNGNNRNENGYRNNGYRPRGNGASNGERGSGRNVVERRNGVATGDVKASQVNGHVKAQARN